MCLDVKLAMLAAATDYATIAGTITRNNAWSPRATGDKQHNGGCGPPDWRLRDCDCLARLNYRKRCASGLDR
jgi:hypothetical protein